MAWKKLDCAVAQKSTFIKTESALKELGFVSRLPITAEEVFNFKNEYIEKRNLIAWSFFNPKNPSEIVDIVITHDLSKLSSIKVKILETSVSILAIDNLIEMKAHTGRPQDKADVEALRKLK